jgi:hypothetical protein
VAFTEDFAAFFSTDDFAVEAVWSGSATAITGIFDKAYVDPIDTEASGPRFECAAFSVPTVKHNDTLIIASVTYRVRGVMPDGTGVVVLKLEKQ